MRGTLSGYYNNPISAGIDFLVRWLRFALKQEVESKIDKITNKKQRFLKLTEDELLFLKAYTYVSQMNDDSFIYDFISTIMYLRAGFTRLPDKKLYYDIAPEKGMWAWIYAKDTPGDCLIFNVRDNGEKRIYDNYNHAKPFDDWNVTPFVILHELCHLITFFIHPNAQKSDPPQSDAMRVEWNKISRYGSTLYCEYCAEATTYLFSNYDYIPKQYLRFLPQVSELTHADFAIPYSNLLKSGYNSLYDTTPQLIVPADVVQDFSILKKNPKWEYLEKYGKDIEWASKNYFNDAAANVIIDLVCWYMNEVYDRFPPMKLHKLSTLL